MLHRNTLRDTFTHTYDNNETIHRGNTTMRYSYQTKSGGPSGGGRREPQLTAAGHIDPRCGPARVQGSAPAVPGGLEGRRSGARRASKQNVCSRLSQRRVIDCHKTAASRLCPGGPSRFIDAHVPTCHDRRRRRRADEQLTPGSRHRGAQEA